MDELERLLTAEPAVIDPSASVRIGTVVSADASGVVVRLRGGDSPKLAHVQPLTAAPAVGAVVAVQRQGAQLIVLGGLGAGYPAPVPPPGPGAWVPFPGGPNWVANDGTTAPRYRKETTGMVHMDGAVRNVAGFSFAGVNQILGTVGVGYRPLQVQVITAIDVDVTNGPRPVCLQINATDGNVIIVNAGSPGVTGGINSVVFLSNISYPAA